MFTEVAPGAYAVDHRVAEGKNGILIGSRAALAIDTGIDPAEGRAMAEFIRNRGHPADRLVLTHGHGDHILGSGAFRGGEVYSHEGAPGVMRRELARAAARGAVPEVAWPTATFPDRLELDLGGLAVRLFHAPGHSPDGLCAYVAQERLLFAADTVVTGIVPAIGDGDSREMEATLGRLLALEIEVLVPGHGPVIRGAAAAREWLEWQAGYLRALRAHVRAGLARGESDEELAAGAEYSRFAARLPEERHGMPRRHRSALLRVAAEEREAAGAGAGRESG